MPLGNKDTILVFENFYQQFFDWQTSSDPCERDFIFIFSGKKLKSKFKAFVWEILSYDKFWAKGIIKSKQKLY